MRPPSSPPAPALPGLLPMLGLLLAACTGHGMTNSFQWKTNFYSVTGTNLGDLHRSLAQARPWRTQAEYVGLTDWRIQWRYETAPAASGCRCVTFTTQTTITTTLPRWVPPKAAPDEVKREWDRFITALGEHEQGHARLALAALADLHRQVRALPSEKDCGGMQRSIEATARRVINEHRQRDLDYDRRTRHGADQGASLPGISRPPR